MEYLEFRRILASDPDCRDEEFLRMKREDSKCAAAADAAACFERKLERALNVSQPDGLVDRIILGQTTPAASRRRRHAWSWAMAATIAVGVALGVSWRTITAPSDLASSVVAHLKYEAAALMRTEVVENNVIQARFAEFDYALAHQSGDALGAVVYAMRCPMPTGDGVHLVVRQPSGPVTVFFMPEHTMTADLSVDKEGVTGVVTPLESGSLALLGGTSDERAALARLLRDSIVSRSDSQHVASL